MIIKFAQSHHKIMPSIARILAIVVMCMLSSGEMSGNDVEKSSSPRQLCDLCEDALSRRDYNTVDIYATALVSQTAKDSEGIDYAYGLFYKGVAEIFTNHPDKRGEWLEDALSISKKIGNDTLTGKVLNCMGIYEANVHSNYYLAQHYLISSLDYPGGGGGAYSNLAQIARLQRDTTGIHYAIKCYEYGIKNDDLYFQYSGLMSLAEFRILREEYSEALEVLERADALGRSEGFADRSRIDFLRGVVMSHQGKIAESKQILLSIQDTIRQVSPIYLHELQYVMGKNCEKEGNLAEANKWLLIALESSERYGSADYRAQIYKQLADNYKSLGDHKTANHYLSIAYEAVAAAAVSERQRMVNERTLTLRLIAQEHESDLARQRARTQRVVIVLLSVLLAMAAVVIVLIHRSLKRRKRQYRNLVNQNILILREKAQYEARLKGLDGSERIDSTPEAPEEEGEIKKSVGVRICSDKSRQLFETLQQLMTEERLFSNPGLTRDVVLERLSTNATYLTQCIRENVDMNYSQYINSFRIAEAVRLLESPENTDCSIKEIAKIAGFNSQTTFYKVFQQVMGISPAAYRDKTSNA